MLIRLLLGGIMCPPLEFGGPGNETEALYTWKSCLLFRKSKFCVSVCVVEFLIGKVTKKRFVDLLNLGPTRFPTALPPFPFHRHSGNFSRFALPYKSFKPTSLCPIQVLKSAQNCFYPLSNPIGLPRGSRFRDGEKQGARFLRQTYAEVCH